MTEEPTGILNPAAIDAITTGDDGIVELHIEQTAPWDGTDHLLLLTQEKLWNYLAYIADGKLAGEYPAAREAPATSRTRRRQERSDARSRATWRVVFETHEEPDRRTVELLQRAGEQFRRLGGALVTRRMPADR